MLDRIKKLEANLKNFSKITEKKELKHNGNSSMFVFSEIFAGIFTGAFIGYMLDIIFSSKIVFLIVLTILGFFSSLYNIYKKYR